MSGEVVELTRVTEQLTSMLKVMQRSIRVSREIGKREKRWQRDEQSAKNARG